MKTNGRIGLLIVRLVLGLVFVVHGYEKIVALSTTASWFDSIGIPGFIAYLVAAIEFGGGILMIVGFLTRIVGGLFALVMVGAMATVKLPGAFVGGFELDLILLAVSLMFALSGSSFVAVDSMMAKKKE
ncbi:DoxX family protein [Aureibacillus halotolerans]|uniref:Putative membrane protein YphA (DoxX/SURF4 family) n=1 Tax=Aureibacillus halotolerans TaxID=1508390 RepID=A0A4R6U467_9BACI|nr:DoxX family protein [Aureibacillus halotolerans]TDQ40891.1 putative membrane protein YphA (DoxX/SURF4 family) [Aureibacillus halotolerans]